MTEQLELFEKSEVKTKKPSVKETIRKALLSKEWVSNWELAALFPPQSKGCLSWGQRLRDLRQEFLAVGGDILTRHKSGGTYEYSLVKPNQ